MRNNNRREAAGYLVHLRVVGVACWRGRRLWEYFGMRVVAGRGLRAMGRMSRLPSGAVWTRRWRLFCGAFGRGRARRVQGLVMLILLAGFLRSGWVGRRPR